MLNDVNIPPASAGKRIAAGLIDLILIPSLAAIFISVSTIWFLGFGAYNTLFYLFYIAWVFFRDMVYSPGRALLGIKLISLKDKEITFSQTLQRNLLIILPVISMIGFVIELVAIIATGQRSLDPWASTRVVDSKEDRWTATGGAFRTRKQSSVEDAVVEPSTPSPQEKSPPSEKSAGDQPVEK